MSDKVEVNNSGMGVASVLTIIFVLAKLFGVISWSWWVVFLPLIISFSLAIVLIGVAMVIAGIAVYFGSK